MSQEKNKKQRKPFKGVHIWDFLNKIPAGTMFVPLIIGSIITTLCAHVGGGLHNEAGQAVTLWQYLGNPMQDLFGASGQMLIIGLMLFCTGTMIKPHDFIEVGKRGIWIIIARLVPAYIISALVFIFAPQGFLGIDPITLTCVVTSANAALYMGIVQPYADDSDLGTFPIMLILSMPLLPFIFLSSFGTGSQSILTKIIQIFSLLIPFILGFILGNLDPKIRTIFKGGNAILLPFLGFQFGSTIDLVKAFQGEVILAALVVTLIYYAVTLIIPYIVDRFILKRPGYASVGSASLAGVSLSIPAMVATYMYNGISGAELAAHATSILAFVLFITNILCPFITNWVMTYYFKTHQKEKTEDPKRVFGVSHPELLACTYDESGNYIKRTPKFVESFKAHMQKHKKVIESGDSSSEDK